MKCFFSTMSLVIVILTNCQTNFTDWQGVDSQLRIPQDTIQSFTSVKKKSNMICSKVKLMDSVFCS